uniref:Ig-like domain-containing protein n=1 Tax=Peromyscus maniculatus bairdii TaxID=230844 RepID=A0A8C8UCU1_PERMB
MAWEATCLLSPILLVLLASGSWAHDTVLHHTVEGKTVFVRCHYDPSQRFKEKVWCQETPGKTCKILVSTNTTDAQQSKFFLQDYPDYQFFTVTITALTVRDSGPYFCGIAENLTTISVLRNIYLKLSKALSTIYRKTALFFLSSPRDSLPPGILPHSSLHLNMQKPPLF